MKSILACLALSISMALAQSVDNAESDTNRFCVLESVERWNAQVAKDPLLKEYALKKNWLREHLSEPEDTTVNFFPIRSAIARKSLLGGSK